MALFKCKMCGGELNVQEGMTVCECEYCGTKQTLPKLDDEKRINLYERANHFRRNNEFDKAMGIYEMILGEDHNDAEAYWSIVLCRYGIEYVDDPATHKKVPTVNRAQLASIYNDSDYQKAIANADGYQRDVYEAEAKAIDEIQKGILEISNKEEPYDVFICYKETDAQGRRTHDSVYAQDIYNSLIKEGYRVFFSRITLEDKIGTAYEPYIFAALNSAKVMLVIGTSAENMNAVWVKNEWGRYLGIVKQDNSKALIPCYKDMSPYDMPEEFAFLQAQDMGKIGFMQDLIHGVQKVVSKNSAVKETVVINNSNPSVEPLLKRAFMFLEDKDWSSADEYCEKVLDQDPENAMAYLGKLMVDLHIKAKDDLKNCKEQFDSNNNYQKVMRFGDEKLQSELQNCIEFIVEHNEMQRLENERIAEEKRIEGTYNNAVRIINSGKNVDELEKAIKLLTSIIDYKNSREKIDNCKNKIEQIIQEEKQLKFIAKSNYIINKMNKTKMSLKCAETEYNSKIKEIKLSNSGINFKVENSFDEIELLYSDIKNISMSHKKKLFNKYPIIIFETIDRNVVLSVQSIFYGDDEMTEDELDKLSDTFINLIDSKISIM